MQDQMHSHIAGTWVGEYSSPSLSGGKKFKITLSFLQLTNEALAASPMDVDIDHASETVAGCYVSETGAIGTISGTISNNIVRALSTQTTPGCKGEYSMDGQVNGDVFTWTFSGADSCTGSHTGNGRATKIS